MRYWLVALCALLFLSAVALNGQGPDEKYVTIYNLIQEGDKSKAKQELQTAAQTYAKAYSLLKDYPELHPGWNENVVNYRINYLTNQLAQLASFLASTNQTRPPPPLPPPPAAVETPLVEPVKAAPDELARLTKLNLDLEAKLKEALSVQPSAVDARALAKAEETNQQLQKEIALLRVSLEQEKAKSAPSAPAIPPLATAPAAPPIPPAPVVDPAVAEREQILLRDLKERLVRQNALIEKLQGENVSLKAQLTLATSSVPIAAGANPASKESLVAQATMAALQATNVALKTEKILLETRLEDLAKEVANANSDKVKQLVRQRDELREKLSAAMKQLDRYKSRSASWRADDVAQQLESVMAKLDVYEAKAVPYTADELALFKRGGTNAPASLANAEKVTIKELPPGTGPLVAEAMQATKEKRFNEAERLLLQVLRQDANHIFTLDNLAAIQLKQDHLEDAEKTIQHALQLEPKNPNTLFLLGHLKYKQAKYNEAFDVLSLSAKLNAEDPWTQYFLGQTLIQKGDRTAAETALRKAIQLNPDWSDAHHSLALVYATQQPPFKELAQWHYNKALAKGHPADPELRRLIGEGPAEAVKP